MMKNPTGTERGSTMIEALVVSLILTFVLGVATSLFASASSVFSHETTTVELQADLAGAKQLLLDDLSVVGYSPDGAVAGPAQYFPEVSFASGHADRVGFVADVNSDGTSDRVCYRLDGGRLEREIRPAGSACTWNQAETLASDVESLDLTFLDANRTVLTSEAQVSAGLARTVRVELRVGAPSKAGKVVKALLGETAIRN